MPATITRDDPKLSEAQMLQRLAPFATKIAFFAQHGYEPHYHQLLFHTAQNPDTHRLARYRSLAAGRRGGKTLSAAKEVAFYMEFPDQYHRDRHGVEDDRPLHVYALTENYKRLLPAYRAFKDALRQHGLIFGRDVKERIADKTFEFANGSLIEFRSADEPDSLRGAGLDILWIDEAAFLRNDEAYKVVRPALADKQGIVICTTTPNARNWYWERFWQGNAMTSPDHFRVSYWSLDNPHFPVAEWEEERADTHPLIFATEYMASFDVMMGNALSSEWLHYYTDDDVDGKQLEMHLGVDPAISLSGNADRFVITCIGIDRKSNQVYMIDQWAGRIPFPDQVELIEEWYHRFNPVSVGIETVAYQAAISQQVLRLDSFIPVIDIQAKGKKFERILGMSPLFKAARIKIKKSHTDFIQEWLDYDPSLKDPNDDCLDSTEIALRSAGVLTTPHAPVEEDLGESFGLSRTMSSQEASDRRFQRLRQSRNSSNTFDEFDYSL